MNAVKTARLAVAALVAVAALLAVAATASAQAGAYTRCGPGPGATVVAVSVATCDEAVALAAALAAAPATATETVLRSTGWTPLRARATDDETAYDLTATRGLATVLIRRPGKAPDLDGWTAGRELILSRGRLVGGKPVPKGSVLCTSAFLIRVGGHAGGLSAAHCAGRRSDGTTQRRNAGLRRSPQPGIILGRVRRNLARTRPLDALVLPVPSGPGRPSAAVVNRGASSPPWFVAGIGRPLTGRRVCFTGRTSGVDRCGKITGAFPGTLPGARPLRCTTITAREGDSGGPVYTLPRSDGTVRAVGITTLVYGLLQTMCFTPVGPVLDALHATLVTAGAS